MMVNPYTPAQVTEPCMLADMPAKQYHEDPCPEPSLNSGVARVLVDESPAHARLAHPRLGGRVRRASREMDEGSLVHAALLRQPSEVVLIEADSYRTKAAQQARDAAHAEGRTPYLAAEWDVLQRRIRRMDEAVRARGVDFDRAERELSIFWRPGPWCRGRIDALLDDTAIDLKTCESANPARLSRRVIDFGWDIQAAAYLEGLSALAPETRWQWEWVFVEREEPFAVTVAVPTEAMLELGRERWARARREWEACLKRDTWPSYSSLIVHLDPPAWAMREEMLEDRDA